ncbi:hypothetical protein CDAR_395971 [Caerostris darwini]|uniref:Secreted protein n=1 Tax=Caerostris darwini TaxID=1538125 RepID=A0AAV4WQD4_9ARAC|nr:hypothetical protein CDAR_395971 [Caerostris darwini]
MTTDHSLSLAVDSLAVSRALVFLISCVCVLSARGRCRDSSWLTQFLRKCSFFCSTPSTPSHPFDRKKATRRLGTLSAKTLYFQFAVCLCAFQHVKADPGTCWKTRDLSRKERKKKRVVSRLMGQI